MTAKRHIYLGDQLAGGYNDPDGALAEYRKAIELDPTLERAYSGIGRVHFFAEPPDTAEAIRAFREAIKLKPTWSESHFWLGLAFMQQKTFREALHELQTAVALSETEDQRLFIALGRCLHEVGKFGEAAKAFRKGIELSKTDEMGYRLYLADSLLANREIEAAREQWRRVVNIPRIPYIPASDSELEDEFYAEEDRKMKAQHLFEEELIAKARKLLDETCEL